jgi:hypothetical protein
MAAEDVTIGELCRRLSAMESRMNAQFSEVNRRLDNLQFVPRDVYQAEMRAHDHRLIDLEEDRKWNRRAIVTSFVWPIIVGLLLAAMVTR